MVVDDLISQALNRSADGIEENNTVLNRIANHYDGVVPVMTRNAKRVERIHDLEDESFGDKVKSIFSPQTNN